MYSTKKNKTSFRSKVYMHEFNKNILSGFVEKKMIYLDFCPLNWMILRKAWTHNQ